MGGTYTMNAEQAAQAARAHWPADRRAHALGRLVGTEKDVERLGRLMPKGVRLVVMTAEGAPPGPGARGLRRSGLLPREGEGRLSSMLRWRHFRPEGAGCAADRCHTPELRASDPDGGLRALVIAIHAETVQPVPLARLDPGLAQRDIHLLVGRVNALQIWQQQSAAIASFDDHAVPLRVQVTQVLRCAPASPSTSTDISRSASSFTRSGGKRGSRVAALMAF